MSLSAHTGLAIKPTPPSPSHGVPAAGAGLPSSGSSSSLGSGSAYRCVCVCAAVCLGLLCVDVRFHIIQAHAHTSITHTHTHAGHLLPATALHLPLLPHALKHPPNRQLLPTARHQVRRYLHTALLGSHGHIRQALFSACSITTLNPHK